MELRPILRGKALLRDTGHGLTGASNDPRLGRERFLDELAEAAEIGSASYLVRVVVIGAWDDVPVLRRLGRIEDLASQFDGDDIVLVAMNNQLR